MEFGEQLVAALKRRGFSTEDSVEIADWYLGAPSSPFPANFQRAVLAANGYDPSQPRNADGEWTAGGGARPREHRDKGFQDRYGNGNPDTLAANPQMNIERGKAVFTRLARKQTGEEPHAMYRKGLGWIGVVVHDGADVITGDRHGHFRAELLIDVVYAYLAELIARFDTREDFSRSQVGVQSVENILCARNHERSVAGRVFLPATPLVLGCSGIVIYA